MVKGTVKWYNRKKGYGFIVTEEGKDIFVHYSAIIAEDDDEYVSLNENDEVEFEIVEGQKGPQASNVVITRKAPTVSSRINRFEVRGGKHSGGYKRKGGRRKEFEHKRSTKF